MVSERRMMGRYLSQRGLDPSSDGDAGSLGVGSAAAIASAETYRSSELGVQRVELGTCSLGAAAVIEALRLFELDFELGAAGTIFGLGAGIEDGPGIAEVASTLEARGPERRRRAD